MNWHINYDIRLSSVVTVMVGFVVILSDFFSRALFWGGSTHSDNDEVMEMQF